MDNWNNLGLKLYSDWWIRLVGIEDMNYIIGYIKKNYDRNDGKRFFKVR